MQAVREKSGADESMPIRYIDKAAGNDGDNSPAIHRWEKGSSSKPSPVGTEEPVLSSHAGLCRHYSANPAMNRWAIATPVLATNRIGMDDSLLLTAFSFAHAMAAGKLTA